ncbi:MAG TPA: ACT domain-containing protein [Firmicutes bacterium]|nr:ACT domain-containing protein [Bacillota bacterium]
MKIQKIHRDFSVCKVMDYSLVNLDTEYSFIGKTSTEKSLVCLTDDVPPNAVQRDDGWRAFCIQGALDFSLIGILAGIAGILADNAIPIFAVSTFDTDYILIKKENYPRALHILKNAGYEIASTD